MSAKKSSLILSLIILISSVCGTAEAKSVYAITDYDAGTLKAYQIQKATKLGPPYAQNAFSNAADITMTFEEFLGYDGTPIGTYYPGIHFEAASSGQDWVAADATTGNYNVSSWPSGQSWGHGNYWMYDYVFAWTGIPGDNGKIIFDQGATFVELGYSAYSTFNISAYDSGGNLLDSNSGPPNLRYLNNNPNGPGTLRVDWNSTDYIAYIIIGDSGNYWCVDNISVGSVPPCWLELTKVDDVNDGDCVGPGDDVNYTICYSYLGDANCPDINDVNIIDYLPPEVEFISASGPNWVQPDSNTVVWNIGTLKPGDANCVTLKVRVKCAEPNSTITNNCEIKSGEQTLDTADENTPVCCPTLTKADVNDVNCIQTCGDYITYNICYNANGYPDSDVIITDFLPSEADFDSADSNGVYDPCSRTVRWNIGTLEPNKSGCVALTVKVSCVEPNGTITNRCEMRGNCIDITANENTPICCSTIVICSTIGSYTEEVMADNPCLYIRFEEDEPCDWSGNDYWVEAHPRVIIEKTVGSMGKAAYLNGGYVAAANQQTEPNLPTQYGHQYAFAPNAITFEFWLYTPQPDALDDFVELFSQSESIIDDSNNYTGRYAPEATRANDDYGTNDNQKCRMAFGDNRVSPPLMGQFRLHF